MTKKIQVFGSGCPTCKKLHERTQEAVQELGWDLTVEYISDIQKIIDLGLMTSPVLVVDDEVKISGRNPDKEEIKKVLQ